MRISHLINAVVCACGWGIACVATADAPSLSYNRDIKPLLSDNCFHCHGPDANHRQADLRLDQRDAAVEFGAIVPGSAAESSIVDRIFSTDPDSVMPPPDSHKLLTEDQKELLKRWVEDGAQYETHWAYAPLPSDDSLASQTVNQIASAIDNEVQKNLQAKNLPPTDRAEKSTLIRRLYLDLIGIPPTPQEVKRFVTNTDSDAYEQLVDELLQSPHFGERMAIPWLDVVRYADTVGFHGDQNMNVWAYRDYVIDSFNKNKPFDVFTIEQLAGDLLPSPSPEQLVATCFNRLNMMTREGGAQPKEYLAKYSADRVRTVGMTWLGSTFGCAECHDHKFDPITAKDFYSMAAFFADIKQWGVYADYGYTPNPDLRGYNNDFPFPPEISVRSSFLERKRSRLLAEIENVVNKATVTIKSDETLKNQWVNWCSQIQNHAILSDEAWIPLSPSSSPIDKGDKVQQTTFIIEDDRSIRFVSDSSKDETIEFTATGDTIAAVRLEILRSGGEHDTFLREHLKTPKRKASSDVVEFTPTFSLKNIDSGKQVPIRFRHAASDTYVPKYSSGDEIIGIHNGWKLNANNDLQSMTGYWFPERPLTVGPGEQLVVSIKQNPWTRIRVSTTPLALANIEKPWKADRLRVDAPENLWVDRFLRSTNAIPEVLATLHKLDNELLECRDAKTPVLVTEAISPAPVRILPRGDWQDDSGDVVKPAIPEFLATSAKTSASTNERLDRLDLAKWLVSPENPLTSRVFVNRLWQQYFGTALSARPDDFGAQGEAPSHPALLDYLAATFRDGGWNIKKMVKSIVMTSTYRQSSNGSATSIAVDPDNRYLSRQSPRRLEAEIVRDKALSIAGLLNMEIGGPSIKPYQPDGLYANLQFPDRPYHAEDDTDQYRRGVYVHWQRTFLHPMLISFGAPTREDCIAARVKANTPQQALTLLNDPSMVEAAVAMADQLLSYKYDSNQVSDEARLSRAYQLALSRDILPEELESMQRLINALRDAYRQSPEDAHKLVRTGLFRPSQPHDPIETAVWSNVCRVILNLHETITRY